MGHEERGEHYSTNQIVEEPKLNRKTDTDIYRKIVKPDLDLARELKKHYLFLRDRLTKNLGLTIRERYEQILEEIFELFEPPNDATGSQDASEWRLEYPPLYGLATVTHAIETAAEYLGKSADIIYPRLRRHEIGSDEYLANVANEDAQFAHRNFVQFRRKERTFLSWIGFLIKLIPAWTLLTGILFAFPGWGLWRWIMVAFPSWPGEWCAAIVAFLALTVIATIEYASWQNDLSHFWNWLKHKTLKEIGETVLQITYKVLRDYRMLMVGRLQEAGAVLRELVKLLKKVEEEYRSLTVEIEDRFARQQKGQASIYWLTDLTTCDNWAKQALKAVDAVQLAVDPYDQKRRPLFNIQTRTILEMILKSGPRFSYGQGAQKALSHREIYDQIETVAQQAVNIVSNARLEYSGEEHTAEIAYTPVGGLTVTVPLDKWKDPKNKPITNLDALRRMVQNKPVHIGDEKRGYRRVTGREPINFLGCNELDICVLIEREELLKTGNRWRWLFQRAVPLGNGVKTKAFAFLTTQHDSVWRVSAFGQYSPHWIWRREEEKSEEEVEEQKKEIVKAKSVLPNEIGCVRAIVEYK